MGKKYFAVVKWMAEDIQNQKPDWSLAKCRRYLEENEGAIHDVLVEHGNMVLSDLNYDDFEDDEND